MTESPNCVFCHILQTKASKRKWFDKVLFERDGISVLPGLGAQREGYLLIVPQVHAFSCAELSEKELRELEGVKEEVAHILNQVYGPCIFFEHGACGHSRRAGSCIDHVHVHALPLEASVVEPASVERPFVRVPGFEAVQEWVQKPYISIQDQNGAMFIADGEGSSAQFVRRVIGNVIGSPDDWDYEAFPHEERMRKTIDRLGELFEGIEEVDPRYNQRWQRSGPEVPLVYVARAVDNRPSPDVRQEGENLRRRISEAGFAAVDPVASPFPRSQVPTKENRDENDFGRVRSDLAWLRRCDAVVIDMSLEDWSYVGCVCELVYAYLWEIPTIIMAGSSPIQERLWLRYHASKIVHEVDEAIAELRSLFGEGYTPAKQI